MTIVSQTDSLLNKSKTDSLLRVFVCASLIEPFDTLSLDPLSVSLLSAGVNPSTESVLKAVYPPSLVLLAIGAIWNIK